MQYIQNLVSWKITAKTKSNNQRQKEIAQDKAKYPVFILLWLQVDGNESECFQL